MDRTRIESLGGRAYHPNHGPGVPGRSPIGTRDVRDGTHGSRATDDGPGRRLIGGNDTGRYLDMRIDEVEGIGPAQAEKLSAAGVSNDRRPARAGRQAGRPRPARRVDRDQRQADPRVGQPRRPHADPGGRARSTRTSSRPRAWTRRSSSPSATRPTSRRPSRRSTRRARTWSAGSRRRRPSPAGSRRQEARPDRRALMTGASAPVPPRHQARARRSRRPGPRAASPAEPGSDR